MRNSIVLLLLLLTSVAFSQRDISVADIYQSGVFRQQSVYGINWMNDGAFYTALKNNNVVKYDLRTGNEVETIVDGRSLEPAITIDAYEFNAAENKLLLRTGAERIYRRSFTAEYYVYDLATKTLTSLSPNGRQSYATFSPDSKKVAFVRKNNLFYVELETMKEHAVTSDGEFNHIINGSTDWVYEEELSFVRAFEWSGDSQSIFFLSFDESGVREYNLQLWNNEELYPTDYRFKYPKAGEDNSKVTAHLYQLGSNETQTIAIGDDQEYYIARIFRTAQDNEISLIRLNRLQNQLDILHVNTNSGKVKNVLTEQYDTYVDVDFVDDLTYLEDGKHFIHSSEQSGFKHLYLYTTSGELVRPITSGNFEVSSFLGVDENKRKPTVYFTSTELSSTDRTFYSVDLNGKNKTTIRGEEGVHRINMSSDFAYYLDYHSSASQPLQVTLYETRKNKAIKVLEDNKAYAERVASFKMSPKELTTIELESGVELNTYMIKPTDFDAQKAYPLLIFQYSGPGSQQVMNSWAGSHFYWHQMLAQKGYIVAVIDPRGTGGKGEAWKKMTYKQLGKYESEDLIAAAILLGERSYIDASRIGIWGWSYGGYNSALSLFKGHEVFKAGISVAPVTNWRFYDTIYTERYMALPQENGDGYDDNSPTSYAQLLDGNFLLIHGTGDDNVHFQNSVVLQNRLISFEKQFDSFYYPDRAHGISSNNARYHLFTLMTNWVEENL